MCAQQTISFPRLHERMPSLTLTSVGLHPRNVAATTCDCKAARGKESPSKTSSTDYSEKHIL
jgi:hypothetical protein